MQLIRDSYGCACVSVYFARDVGVWVYHSSVHNYLNTSNSSHSWLYTYNLANANITILTTLWLYQLNTECGARTQVEAAGLYLVHTQLSMLDGVCGLKASANVCTWCNLLPLVLLSTFVAKTAESNRINEFTHMREIYRDALCTRPNWCSQHQHFQFWEPLTLFQLSKFILN